ncbi:hypothetical protein [Demequina sp. NBRC 110057]|uniref:hypothetical protein n=1 Tax=Demequina sp. NBRC 110057 TaxID=1570346 RepID=UPI000A05961E|nr:hypothetical protein [Demequina sp. NBRC 110057]
MRRLASVALAAVAAALLAACGGGGDDSVSETPGPTSASATPASVTPTPSPSDLPTLATPTAPPTSPTDVTPASVVAGRVTAVTDGCVEVTTDDAAVWSLTGDAQVALGDTVRATVADLAADAAPCGKGRGARLEKIEVAGP